MDVADMVSKERQARGITQGNSRLTEKEVLEIRSSCLTYNELATLYNVCWQNISAIINRRAWKHLKQPGYQRRLTEVDVRMIRKAFTKGSTLGELAGKYQVTPENINLIIKRKTWKHV